MFYVMYEFLFCQREPKHSECNITNLKDLYIADEGKNRGAI